MKTYKGKTLEQVLEEASNDLGIPIEDLCYEVLLEEKRLFSKKVEIEVYETSDIVNYVVDYLNRIISLFVEDPHIKPSLNDDVIRLEIETNHNSILIGKNGRTLAALNELVKIAAMRKFKKRVRILLDINDYKSDKYRKITSHAKRLARNVIKTKKPVTLDPMTADERRAVHNALGRIKGIKTESTGTGYNRRITISVDEPLLNEY